jgi:hypothetical protein
VDAGKYGVRMGETKVADKKIYDTTSSGLLDDVKFDLAIKYECITTVLI